VTNLLTYRQEFITRQNYEVKLIRFLDPFDIVCATDSVGNVIFMALGQNKLRNKVVLKVPYKT
jgi:hypothetical protein